MVNNMCTLCITSNRIIICVYAYLLFFCMSVHGQLLIMHKLIYQPVPRWSVIADIPQQPIHVYRFRAGLILPACLVVGWWCKGLRFLLAPWVQTVAARTRLLWLWMLCWHQGCGLWQQARDCGCCCCCGWGGCGFFCLRQGHGLLC